MKKILICLGLLIFLSSIAYQLTYPFLLQQVKNPQGFVGNIMIQIWNKTFVNMTIWGIKDISFEKDASILDVGCGGGQAIATLDALGVPLNLTGIDISDTAIEAAKSTNMHSPNYDSMQFFVADVAQLPLESNHFDKAFAFQTHMYWDDLAIGLKELHRVLIVEGEIHLITEIDKIDTHMTTYTTDAEITTLLKELGFTSVTIEKQNNWLKISAIKGATT